METFKNVPLIILTFQASAMNVNPLHLILPGVIACNYSYMLPAATPPNAIVYAYGHMSIMDMVIIQL